MEKDELRDAILRRLPDAYTEHYEAWRRFNRLYVAASAGGVIAILGAIGTRLGDPEQAVVDPRLFVSLSLFLFSLLLAWFAAGGDGTLVMRSDNPQYEPDRIPADRAGEVRLVGRVRWIARLL